MEKCFFRYVEHDEAESWISGMCRKKAAKQFLIISPVKNGEEEEMTNKLMLNQVFDRAEASVGPTLHMKLSGENFFFSSLRCLPAMPGQDVCVASPAFYDTSSLSLLFISCRFSLQVQVKRWWQEIELDCFLVRREKNKSWDFNGKSLLSLSADRRVSSKTLSFKWISNLRTSYDKRAKVAAGLLARFSFHFEQFVRVAKKKILSLSSANVERSLRDQCWISIELMRWKTSFKIYSKTLFCVIFSR